MQQISLKTFASGRTVSLDVESSDAIDKVEAKIQDKECEDGCSSDVDDTQKKSTLRVVLRLKPGMQIFVKTPTGKTIPLQVESSDTIHSVKAKIQYSEGIHTYDQKLVFCSHNLADEHVLADCNIQKDSIIHLLHRRMDGMLIFVKTDTGTSIPFEVVVGLDTPKSLMFDIQRKEGIPFEEQKLVFAGELLQHSDCRTLKEYDIKEESTLYLVRALRGGMLIFVKTILGMRFPLEVKCSDTVGCLKAKIRDMVGIPLPEQRLVFGSKQLQDDVALADHNIVENSTLLLIQILLKPKLGR